MAFHAHVDAPPHERERSSIVNLAVERFDQGAGHGAIAGPAGANHRSQYRFNALEVGELDPHVLEPAFAQFACLVAVHAVIELQQAGNLVEAETQTLGRLDELQAGNVAGSVAAETSLWSHGFAQQALALVEPDGFDVDPYRLGDGTDGHVNGLAEHASIGARNTTLGLGSIVNRAQILHAVGASAPGSPSLPWRTPGCLRQTTPGKALRVRCRYLGQAGSCPGPGQSCPAQRG